MPGITISSEYGAGGALVAPKVAQQLGLPLLDKAIDADVARSLDVSEAEAHHGERKGGWADRFFSAIAPVADTVFGDTEQYSHAPNEFRDQAENIMRSAIKTGAVVFGRAGAAALADQPDVLRVRLYGEFEDRVANLVRTASVSEEQARSDIASVDGGRAKYMQHLYERDITDRSLYHLMINGPTLTVDECVGVIVAAYGALSEASTAPAAG
ncbi:cytidylate kinase [Branchiibius hedensis]|uniref:Cytidylate kinase n=1 Tax=Branchiibius hedensis TaxID=672460 RepID=A0A2Y9BT32_9MICO|nr:cytidylate kinase-like family protein [Branchiibius hedensis]PWJ24525.1 cytidylate kinase [Branchiibius hedensis]SSA33342.1 Cytidylate kinase [Branchiibius hedensis]